MTEPTTVDVQQTLQQGRAAALAGDTFAARAHFRRVTEIDPGCAEAWLGLSGVVPILSEKQTYLRRALELDPGSAEAAASLRYVEQLLAEGLQLAPSQRRAERAASGDASPLLSAPEPEGAPGAAAEVEHCYRHPDRETGLHCTVCGRPICGHCARMTPVGQLCPDDRRARRPVNYKVSASNLLAGGGVALALAGVAAALLGLIGFGGLWFLIPLFLGAAVAEGIVRVVDRATRAKRGLAMQVAVGAALALGTVLGAAAPVLGVLLFSGAGVLPLVGVLNLPALLYMIALVATASMRLR